MTLDVSHTSEYPRTELRAPDTSRTPSQLTPIEPQVSTVKGRTARRWTHNEQLFVRCCGVIVSRATFFGSEGVSGVKVCASPKF